MQAVLVGVVGTVVPVVYEVDGLVVVGVVGSQVGWLVEDLVVYVVDDLVVVSHCDDVGGLAVVVEPD